MDEQEIDLRAILGVLRRHIRLIVLVVVTVLVITGGVVYSLKPEYTATTLVYVDTARKDLLDPEALAAGSSAADNARVDSEVEIVRSIPTLLRVIQDANLLNDPEFMPKLGLRQELMAFLRLAEPTLPTGEEALNNLVERLRGAISVQRRGLTYLISINAEAASPATAARIANATADAYIALQIQSKTQSVLNSLDVLEPRISEATSRLAQSEGAFDTFVEDNVARLSAGDSSNIEALRQQLAQATSERQRLGSIVDTANQSLQQLNYEQLASSLQSEAVAGLEQQRTDLLNRINSLEPNSTDAVDLRGSLAQVEQRLQTTAQQEIQGLQQQVSTFQDEASGLRDQVRQRFLGSDLPPDVLTSIYELQQNSTLARTNYERLVARVNDLRAQADLQVADSRVVAQATPPNAPSFPNSRLILVLAGLAAVGLGVGLAFVVDNFVGGFTSTDQLETVTRREVITGIPLQRPNKRDDGHIASAADLVVTSPLSHYSESLRRVRLRLDQLLAAPRADGRQRRGKVILVTSSLPVEGKTTTALALARTYGVAGQRVLIIDADLRKPSLHKQLNVESTSGLHEYLAGEISPEESKSIINRDPQSGISVVLSANQSNLPTEHLLTSKTFVQLIEAATQAFDIVVIDTPPAGVVVDGVYLMQFADVILFLTRYASTTQREVLNALKTIDRSKVEDTPLVLAMTQEPGNARSYNYKYSSYYAD
ncbi:AAA family ATPase [Devosia sp. BK]|uniref:GumC family protein n=1 Tax=Devosia sp. BK TaxID=2871706 RepID=UPI002939A23C|nr:Wzz/FepE/Etk N-terminal domain-containing protein [Devosia sp. BK]MDV3253200.1 AAA family ATPase [Devosia sp. BK]